MPLGTGKGLSPGDFVVDEMGLDPGHIVLDGHPAPIPKRGHSLLNFWPILLWPNGWMRQDSTWYGGRPLPRRLCVRWGPSHLPQNGRSPPIFGPRLLWPNDCMDQDATWYGVRPRPTGHCVRWGPSSLLPKGAQLPNFRSMSVVAKGLNGL